VFDRDLEAQLAKLAEATREAKMATSEAHSITKQLRLDMREARQKIPEVMDDEAAKLITAGARKYMEAKLDAMVDELAWDLRKRLGFTE
jgi:F0F1-type ATP synthase membrane subunit b/b'